MPPGGASLIRGVPTAGHGTRVGSVRPAESPALVEAQGSLDVPGMPYAPLRRTAFQVAAILATLVLLSTSGALDEASSCGVEISLRHAWMVTGARSSHQPISGGLGVLSRPPTPEVGLDLGGDVVLATAEHRVRRGEALRR